METFRKASDTRPLPEVPSEGRKRLDVMKSASSAVSAYGPKLGPLGPPLTSAQAEQLVKNSFPKDLYKVIAPYKDELVKLIVEESSKIPNDKRRAFETLDRLSKEVCSYEALPGNISRMTEQLKEVPPSDLENFKRSILQGIAIHIVTGYDIVDSDHFYFDANGVPVGVTPANFTRKKACVASILRREQEGEFRQFLKYQSDPYKGSLQGLGRTRKHKKRSKKTLRKRKFKSTRI